MNSMNSDFVFFTYNDAYSSLNVYFFKNFTPSLYNFMELLIHPIFYK